MTTHPTEGEDEGVGGLLIIRLLRLADQEHTVRAQLAPKVSHVQGELERTLREAAAALRSTASVLSPKAGERADCQGNDPLCRRRDP